MSKMINPLSSVRISLQLNIDYFTLTLASILIVAIVIVIVVVILFYRRRSHPRTGFHVPHHLPMLMTHPQSGIEASPTTTVLEMLSKDLEEASAAHFSGLLTRKEFEERIEEIRKTLDDLRQFRDVTSKHKKCRNCGTEIAEESQYCDRCGTKQEQTTE